MNIQMIKKMYELAYEADPNMTIDGMGYGQGNIEKFYELIVRGCVEYYRSQIGETSEPHTKTLEHFGVEL